MTRIASLAFLVLTAAVSAWPSAQSDASRRASIAAAQKAIEHEFAVSLLSPFTAVASKYFVGGDAARLVVRADGPAFLEPPSPGGAVDVTFDGRDVWVEPIPGAARVFLLKKRGDEGVEPGEGAALAARTRMSDADLVRVGRYYLEAGARPGTGRAILYDPDAPLRKAFAGLHWFPPSTVLQVKATYVPNERPDPIVVTTSRGLEKDYYRAGTFSFEIDKHTLRLAALATSAAPRPGDELFVPFRDATTGHESYAVGRYLNVAFNGPAAAYVLDFNLATNPYCAYSPHYNCVVPPKENTLLIAIRAGEMSYANHPIGGR
jgi:hypothetical protein